MADDHVIQAVILKVGSKAALAQALGIWATGVSQWDRIPAKHVPRISEMTGIPRHELRPDLWEAPATETAA